jgi:PAS domain S-box-containing protein
MAEPGNRAGPQRTIEVSGIRIDWRPEQGVCSFEDQPVAMLRVDTTLAGLMSGVQAMVGTERFLLMLEGEGRKSVETDWQVISRLPDFRAGFRAIANLAAVAGWGDWELVALDETRRECRFRVANSWEGRYQKALGVCWGSGMLGGKLAGYGSRLFGTNCWAEQTAFLASGEAYDEFFVHPSSRSVEQEIENLLATDETTRSDMVVTLRRLQQEIAERTRAEVALDENRSLLQAVVEGTSDTVFVKDREGRYRLMNAAGACFLGRAPETVIGHDDTAFLPPAEATVVMEHDRVLLDSGQTTTFEETITSGEGKPAVFLVTKGPIPDQHGNVAGLFGIARDITERRQAEAALCESEAKFRSLVEATSDWIWETDATGRYTYASPRVRDLLGYEPGEVLGRTPFSLMPPDEAERVRAAFERAAAQRASIVDLRNLNFHRQGHLVVLETSGVPNFDAQGRLQGYRGIDRDVTARTRAEEALREREAFIQALLDTSRDWIWAIDVDGVHTYSNPAVRSILGYDASEIVGRAASDLVVAEDRERVGVELERCVEQRCGWSNLVVRWRHQDGSHRFLESNSVPILDANGRLIGFRGVDRDITERQRAEAERAELERRLLHAQKLESLGVLAGGIAHDFNNMLMAVLGNLDLSLLELGPESPVRAGIELAIQAAHRATGLTRQMLAYSGRGRFVVARMDLNHAVRENAELLRTAIPRTIGLEFRLAPQPVVVMADPDQVQQVIMNLITNAAEAVGNGPGAITLSTGEEDCDAQYLSRSRQIDTPPPGRFAFVEIADTGCGIDSQTLERLFDPFFTTKFTGRGLGMSAVLGIVRGHQGAILVNTAVGEGTTIRVLFPLSEELAVSSTIRPLSPPEPGVTDESRAILVVDDEEAVRRACLRFVALLGYRGIGAADGEEAVALFAQHAAELACVLLDWTMPKMDGMRAFAEMKRLDPNVRVILASGYDDQDGVLQVAREGLAAFIHKPFTLGDLRNKIAEVLGQAE